MTWPIKLSAKVLEQARSLGLNPSGALRLDDYKAALARIAELRSAGDTVCERLMLHDSGRDDAALEAWKKAAWAAGGAE